MKTLVKNEWLLPLALILTYAMDWGLNIIGLNTHSGAIYHLVLVVYLVNYIMPQPYPLFHRILAVLGMILYMVGDFVMGGVIDLPMRLVSGMVMFALGHLVYLGLIWRYSPQVEFKKRFLNLLVVEGLVSVLWAVMVLNLENSVMSFAALGYSFVLGALIAFGWTNQSVKSAWRYVTLGYAIFTFSDLLIGMSAIKGINIPDFLYSNSVWLTYVSALSLVSFAVVNLFQNEY